MRWLLLLAAVPLCAQRVDFQKQIRPIFESACLPCHDVDEARGGFRMNTQENFMRGGSKGSPIVASHPDRSLLQLLIDLPPAKPGSMPPGQQLPQAQRDLIREWIAIGAPWARNIVIGKTAPPVKDEMATVRQIRERIVAQADAQFVPYQAIIPGTPVSFKMTPIPAGTFTMGTPPTEKGRAAEEGPQRKVTLDAFWMGVHEVTWDEYRLFMFAQQSEKQLKDATIDAVSRPTRPYVEMSFGMGINGYPAISMTQHAANKYAQWLSARTGHFYRLPTEAEWEYACRAGSNTAYSFGDDAAALGTYAVFNANANGKYALVGSKKPNAWGLHDMHGNVMEWVLDQFGPYAPGDARNPFVKQSDAYGQVARGGSWNDAPAACRCGARVSSDPSWKMQDPQLPKSIWYHTDALWLGFRLVRPVKVPSAEEMFAYWNSGFEQDQ
jgi:formylglycine-generating enzyme required for sulfatase activity